MPNRWADKSLAAKLAAITKDIEPVELFAEGQGDDAFAFMRARDVQTVVRRQLRLKGVTMKPETREYDSTNRVARVHVTFKNVHRPQETESGAWWGEAESDAKRPAAAAQTNGVKGYLAARFQIPAVKAKVDPEAPEARTTSRQQKVLERSEAQKTARRANPS